jgi:hypothetical protein
MSESTGRTPVALGRVTAAAIALLVVGAVVVLVGTVLEWGGFWGGLALGAGIGLTLVGAYFWGFGNGVRRAGPRAVWLPSQDGGE